MGFHSKYFSGCVQIISENTRFGQPHKKFKVVFARIVLLGTYESTRGFQSPSEENFNFSEGVLAQIDQLDT